jgi:hypothetical protein
MPKFRQSRGPRGRRFSSKDPIKGARRLFAEIAFFHPERGQKYQTGTRNFEFSSIITIQSPRPFTQFVGFDANNNGNPVTDRVGTSRRNTYEGDHLRSWDLRLSRTIYFPGERYKLQLAVDGFNILNRANIDEVYSVYGAPDFIAGVPQHYQGRDHGSGEPVLRHAADSIESEAAPILGETNFLAGARRY